MDIRVNISQDIAIDAEDLAIAVANADSLEQNEFFYRLAERVNQFNWCMQSSMIVSEFEENEKQIVIDMLKTFLAHLEETPDETE